MRRRRKGLEYLLEILLRDAQPTHVEIAGEPDPRKRRERERARDVAIDRLTKMYRDAEKRGQIDQLDSGVRVLCELLMDRNDRIRREQLRAAFPEKSVDEIERLLGKRRLPEPKGGRPANQNRRLLIAVRVREAIAKFGWKRGSVDRALRAVANQERKAAKARGARILRDDYYQYVKEIHYDYDRDPELRSDVDVEIDRRKKPGATDLNAAWEKFLSEG